MNVGTVAVTGAGGFVGSAVVRLLVRTMQQGAARFADGTPVERVVAILRPGGPRTRLEEIEGLPGWSAAEVDLADADHLRHVMADVRPRAVLHLAVDWAAYRQESGSNHSPVNVTALRTIFASLRDVDGARAIYTGSAWVLAPGDRLAEGARLDPQTPYARDKVAAEDLLPALQGQTGVNWIGLRLFNIFGRYEHPARLLPYLVRRLGAGQRARLSNPDHVRDFTDVDVMATAYLVALRAPDQACNRIYHVGSGRGTTLREFALTVAAVTGRAELIEFGAAAPLDRDLPILVSDPALAQRALGWDPAPDLAQRIQAAAQWWQHHTRLEAVIQ